MSEFDVVVIGDGPAGSALARACVTRGLDVLLVGDDAAWDRTYGAWLDDLDGIEVLGGHDVVQQSTPVVAHTTSRQEIGRIYAVLDNARLRDVLRHDLRHRLARVTAVRTGSTGRHRIECADGTEVDARVVVDATGWPASFAPSSPGDDLPAWQTAFGVVLSDPPDGDLGEPTFMDFRPPPHASVDGRARRTDRRRRATTFAYSLPVQDGWLVEETVLAARPAVEPVALMPLLAARLGVAPDALLERAVRTEYVRIPMGGGRPRHDQPIVAFGAAAGYVNPISGYSVVHALSMAVPVASAVEAACRDAVGGVVDHRSIWNAVWPAAHRRTRVLHDFGLDMLLRLDGQEVREFFATFFDLPPEVWRVYLDASSPPGSVSAVMARLFASSSWATRRRLVRGNPLALAGAIRPW